MREAYFDIKFSISTLVDHAYMNKFNRRSMAKSKKKKDRK
jgi:hypothetical protein